MNSSRERRAYYLLQELIEGTIRLDSLFQGQNGGKTTLIYLFQNFRDKGYGPLTNPLENFQTNPTRNLVEAAVNADMLELAELVLPEVKKKQSALVYTNLLDNLAHSSATTIEMLELLQKQGAPFMTVQRQALSMLTAHAKDSPMRAKILDKVVGMIKNGDYAEDKLMEIVLPRTKVFLSADELKTIEDACIERQRKQQETKPQLEMKEQTVEGGKRFGV